jgi:hypothetical protein
LVDFVEEVRENGNPVNSSVVTVELMRWAVELAVVGFVPLHHRVLWFL